MLTARCLFVCVATSWFMEVVLIARIWFVELVVIARAVWCADFAVCSGCSLVLARCHFE
ncbi:hypothetical protein glysoja_042086 [Glycine soja]|uniref:Uncharacterized protein n=1 Tax=Glycine soja TaxID=3848 RepID=A0A0B2R560_GLYSO|nr:hypothetical protein glysoja_042086 [Glycine soja]